MHHVKMGGDIFGFIRLNLTNKMPGCLGVLGDFWQGILQVIFAEVALTRIQSGGDGEGDDEREGGDTRAARSRDRRAERGRAEAPAARNTGGADG